MRSNNTHLNILVSYAYLAKNKEFTNFIMDLSTSGVANVMVDSGAFTLYNSKQKRSWLNLDNYCKFLDQWGDKVEKYVMLDVIRNEAQSKKNYEEMVKRGFNPMYVFTEKDKDWSYLNDVMKQQRHICVAGGVSCKSAWMFKRYQDVYKHTNEQALIHGLGFVKYPEMYKLPLHSTDSSSWVQGAQVYGNIPYFDNGMKSVHHKHILQGKKKIPKKLIQLFEQLKITPKEFSDLQSHRGGKSIGWLCSIIAFIEYQKLSKRQDLNLFLASANVNQLKSLVYVNEHYNKGTLTLQNFKQV